MKKFISVLLTVFLLFSVMTPLTAFAENGPYPNPSDNITVEDFFGEDYKMSSIMYMTWSGSGPASVEIGAIYPHIDGILPPDSLKGASYDKASNTLTLKNVRSENTMLFLSAMGDDFKIKLVGYNELGCIASEGLEWGGSITLIGNGELVLNKTKDNGSGIEIIADNTASFFCAEKDVNLKIYCDEFYETSIYIEGSTIADASELIQLKGDVKVMDTPVAYSYTVDIFEQIEGYDFFYNTYEYCDVVLTKEETGDALYAGFEEYDLSTFEPNGKYYVLPIEFDEILNCYTAPCVDETFTSVDIQEEGYSIVMDGAIPKTIENIFAPESKCSYNLATSEDGAYKYGFELYEEYYPEETIKEYTIYTVTEHPTYGYIMNEVPHKTNIDGLVPQKTGEIIYSDAYTESDIVMNNGGTVEPDAVSLVSAVNDSTGVRVKWQPIANATKYKIYRKAEGEKSWKAIKTVKASSTSYTDTTAKSGTKYTYTVRACNIVGWGAYNKTGISVTYLAAPRVTAKNSTNGTKLVWSKIGGASKYNVYRKASGSSEWKKLGSATTTSYTDTSSKSGKTYSYRVRAVNGTAVSGYNTITNKFLAAPGLSSVKNTSSGVKITWNKVSGAAGYKVYRKSDSGSWKLLKTITDSTTLSYNDKTAENGKTYSYSVKAYNGKTVSSFNKTGLKIKHIDTPELKAAKKTTSGIKVSWEKVDGATLYKVFRKTSSSDWKDIGTTEKLTFTDKTAKSGVTYIYTVKAYNGKYVSAHNSKGVSAKR